MSSMSSKVDWKADWKAGDEIVCIDKDDLEDSITKGRKYTLELYSDIVGQSILRFRNDHGAWYCFNITGEHTGTTISGRALFVRAGMTLAQEASAGSEAQQDLTNQQDTFKVGDQVFEINPYINSKIYLTTLTDSKSDKFPLRGQFNDFDSLGRPDDLYFNIKQIFHATEETREHLVFLWGDKVPKIPLSRHEIIKESVKSNPIICRVSQNDLVDINGAYDLITEVTSTGLYKGKRNNWNYAIAVDVNGNEITEL